MSTTSATTPAGRASSLARQEFMEYDQLKAMLDYAPSNGMYEALMDKEEAVLKTINRVVDHSNKKQIEGEEALNVPIRELGRRFGVTAKDMYLELYSVKDAKDVLAVFTKSSDRWIYIGAIIVLVALFLYFVSVTN